MQKQTLYDASNRGGSTAARQLWTYSGLLAEAWVDIPPLVAH